jgi:hypothetical protein
MPGDDVERRMPDLAGVKGAAPFDRQPASRLAVLEGGDGRLEIARIGQTIGADRTTVRKREFRAVILT